VAKVDGETSGSASREVYSQALVAHPEDDVLFDFYNPQRIHRNL
jgi:hypothetical protein